jgi:sugar lactone lactonase YvrE
MAEGFCCAADVQARLGESPVWSVIEQALYFVDIKGRRLHRYDPATDECRAHDLAEDTGCIGLARGGGFIAGARSGLWRLGAGGERIIKLADNPEDTTTSRFNDGRVDPAGRYLAGTLDEPKAGGQAHLYRYDERGLVALASGLLTSNGLAFSPDGRTLYHSDTPRFVIWRYDYDPATGEAENRRVFVQLDPSGSDRGRPDGAAVDSEGCYWSALYEGGRVHRYDPDGRLMSSYMVPARRPTMPAFGGPELKTLYLTTVRDGASPEELQAFPQSGGLFAMELDVAGRPEPLFDRLPSNV